MADKHRVTVTFKKDDGTSGTLLDLEIPAINEDQPSYADDFYRIMGQIVLQWGQVEQLVGMTALMCRIIDESLTGSPHPTLLTRKLALIKDTFPKSPFLQQNPDVWADAVSLIERVANRRNDVMHAAFEGFEDGPPHKMKMKIQRIKLSNKVARFLEHTRSFELKTLEKLVKDMHGAYTHAWMLINMGHMASVLARPATAPDHAQASGSAGPQTLQ